MELAILSESFPLEQLGTYEQGWERLDREVLISAPEHLESAVRNSLPSSSHGKRAYRRSR